MNTKQRWLLTKGGRFQESDYKGLNFNSSEPVVISMYEAPIHQHGMLYHIFEVFMQGTKFSFCNLNLYCNTKFQFVSVVTFEIWASGHSEVKKTNMDKSNHRR